MKLMIASDIHGSALYCQQLLEAYKRESTAFLFNRASPYGTV